MLEGLMFLKLKCFQQSDHTKSLSKVLHAFLQNINMPCWLTDDDFSF